jgi:hypothetical protein
MSIICQIFVSFCFEIIFCVILYLCINLIFVGMVINSDVPIYLILLLSYAT